MNEPGMSFPVWQTAHADCGGTSENVTEANGYRTVQLVCACNATRVLSVTSMKPPPEPTARHGRVGAVKGYPAP